MSLDIKAANAGAAGSGFDQPGQHLNGGGFAGCVGSQHRKKFPARHGQVDIIDRDQFAKSFEKVDKFNHAMRGL